MAEEKDTKKTSSTKSTTKKNTSKKTTTKKTTRTKKTVEEKDISSQEELSAVEEKVISSQEELSAVEEKDISSQEELSAVEEKDISSQEELSAVEEKVIPHQDELSTVQETTPPQVPTKENNNTEESKIAIEIITFIGILILAMGILFGYCLLNKIPHNNQDDFTYIKEDSETIIHNQFKVVSSRHELEVLFPHSTFYDLDFRDNRYVVIRMDYDPCRETEVTPTDYDIDDNGILIVNAQYEADCGGCAPSYLYYLLEIDKKEYEDIIINDIDFVYTPLNNPHCNPAVAYKPIIYFYPEKEEKLHVTLGHPDKLTTTYPKYKNGWDVIAQPGGTLIDENGREYYSLFWEGNDHPATIHEDGFVVAGDDTQSFLEEKLHVLGLNDKEANEFIIYWLPKLENNTYNYIRFETMDEINEYMPLTVTPKPDHMIRIQMDYKPIPNKISVKEQALETPIRSGFTVVEWGGSIIK